MHYKLVALIIHMTTGYSAEYTVPNNYLNEQSCIHAMPSEINKGYKKAALIAKEHGLDGNVKIYAHCVKVE